jgi:phosphatidylserine/phosphatidylglycerophosphate/cardiolipin synthase-like enzyme
MPAFISPVASPGSWSFATAASLTTIPAGLRFAGYSFRALRASIAAGGGVQVPATGILRKATDTGGNVFVEVQVIPFPIRRVATAMPGGLPTFYFVFADATGLTFIDGDGALGGTALRSATSVTIVMAGQDRAQIDPALWAAQISMAIVAGGGDATEWDPFATAVAQGIGIGNSAPVLLYDHAGQLRTSGTLDIVFGMPGAETTYTVALDPADGGDLQRTVARLHLGPLAAPLTTLWGNGAASFRMRPQSSGAGAIQLARLDDGVTAADEIVVTPALRSVAFTDLFDWFAPQYAATGAPNDLRRFSRGNRVTPLVNGPAYFDDFFARMATAQRADGGVALTGWAMFPQTKFAKRKLGDDPEDTLTLTMAAAQIGSDMVPLTLEQAASLIQTAGGQARFLPAKFYTIDGPATVSASEALAFHLVVDAILILNAFGVKAAETDAAGALLLVAAWIAATIYTQYVLDNDGKPIEPNKAAVNVLGAVPGAASKYAPYPARVDDNIPAPPLTSFPFDALFSVTRHFGIYHQKLSIVKVGPTYFGYCGGIDCNPDRLDDANHLLKAPFHDVHARIEGNAVRDLAITFDDRWQRDGGGVAPAFAVPAVDATLAPGTDIAQIARTYFAPATDPAGVARGFSFAPNGDRTIANTMITAIEQARELIYIEDQYLTPPMVYQNALVAKVTSREIRQLIITVPGLTDQPFGVSFRDSFVNNLIAADAGNGIVRIGFPRRRFTSTDNQLRASSGKMLLGQDLPAGGGSNAPIFLGPPSRIPAVPFWVSIEGELIYVYDESGAPNPDSEHMKAFLADRGDATRIVSGGAASAGAYPRAHKAGAAATAVDLSNIYVHAKMMIVDDVFVGIGSANLNRRGLFYDGEISCFVVAEGLRTSTRNSALMLRRQLWAEMFDLPAELAAPLLTDPIAAAGLFGRSPFAGNRHVPLDAQPPNLMLSYAPGDGAVADVLTGLGYIIQASNWSTIFTQVVDPTSRTVNAP